MARPAGDHARVPVHIRLSGSFAVSLDGDVLAAERLGSRKARTLLKLLCVERGRVVGTDGIAEVLWPGESRPRAAEDLATLVSRLRRRLGSDVISGGKGGYRLGALIEVDLDSAADLVEEAEHRLPAEPGLASTAAAGALTLLGTGSALEDEPYAEWAEAARTERAVLLRRARHAAAQAALDTGDNATASATAQAAVAEDRLDEHAYRDLMAAHYAAGEPAKALHAFETLRGLLADELGIDPAPQTRRLHESILRESVRRAEPTPPAPPGPGLPGRSDELARLRAAWSAATAGTGRAVLLVGEAGIGKTRLGEELARTVRQTGGTVLQARCYETERSLPFQPVVDAVAAAAARMPAGVVRDLAGEESGALATLVPAVGAILGPQPPERGPVEFQRRRAFEAVTAFLVRLARREPVAFVLDDLHSAGRSSVELLHYLIRHTAASRLLVLATVRTEAGDEVRRGLREVAEEIELGPLSRAAVAELAASAGQSEHLERIVAQTSGHTLFVVETLRTLRAGSTGVPASLQAAVLDRVRGLGAEGETLLRAGAVLGSTIDPATVGAMLGVASPTAAQSCERALTARLLTVSGRAYEFAHDLVREVLYATTPEPTRIGYHRRAADLLTDQPEAVGAHAAAAGDWERAGRAWLVAGENAMRRLAAADAESLASKAIEAVQRAGDREVRARGLVLRGRAREATGAYQAALGDLAEAVQVAEQTGDRRLEMIARRQLGGDVPVAAGLPADAHVGELERSLRLADALADRTMEADILDRLAVLRSNALRLSDAVTLGRRALAAARSCQDERALALALDGVKTGYAFLGEVGELAPVVAELEPLLRRQGDLWLLQWTVFESALIPLAAGDHAAAADRIEEAVQISRRSGSVSYESWFLAVRGWVERLQGNLRGALEYGRRAADRAREPSHSWWHSAALSMLATTLLEVAEPAEAIGLLEEARDMALRNGSAAYLLRCLAPLAQATGSPAVLAEADALLSGIEAPPGSAWLLGADAYLCLARAWLERGDADRARTVLAPMASAVRRLQWRPLLAPVRALAAATGLQSGDES